MLTFQPRDRAADQRPPRHEAANSHNAPDPH